MVRANGSFKYMKHTCRNQLPLEVHLHSDNTRICQRWNRFHTDHKADQQQNTKPHHIGLEHSMISTKCHLKLQRGFSRRIYHLRSKVFMNLEGGNWSRVHIYVPQLTTKKSRLRENRHHSGTEQKQKESTRLSIFNILSILFHSQIWLVGRLMGGQ